MLFWHRSILFVCQIILEYREILERRFGSSIFAEEVIELIASLPNVEHVSPAYRFNLITADPDDNKFVDCAIQRGLLILLVMIIISANLRIMISQRLMFEH